MCFVFFSPVTNMLLFLSLTNDTVIESLLWLLKYYLGVPGTEEPVGYRLWGHTSRTRLT